MAVPTTRLAHVGLLTVARSEVNLREQGAPARRVASSSISMISPTPAFTLCKSIRNPNLRQHCDFARLVAATVGYTGDISFDWSKHGIPRKLLDVSRWQSSASERRLRLRMGSGWHIGKEADG
jgi:hypothetical protein